MSVDAGDREHEDGGCDEDHVKCCQTNQQAVNGALHLGSAADYHYQLCQLNIKL